MTQPLHLRQPGPGPEGMVAHAYVARPALEGSLVAALEGLGGAQLVGEAGMGKTRLARHVLQDRRCLSVSCADLRRVTARDLAAELLQQVDPAPTDLVHLLRGGSAGDGGTADEALLLKAAGHRLAALIPPVVVLVDDAELLGEGEAAALVPVLTVSERPWVVTSRRRVSALPLSVLEVPALHPAEARQLVDALLPGAPVELRSAVLERAGDSPLFLEQCARLLVENGALRLDERGELVVVEPHRIDEIPRSMRTFVDERLDLLPEQEAHVLGVAAVLGPQAELSLLRFLVGEAAPAIERLIGRGLLRPSTDSTGQPALRFSHALVREAAYARFPVTERVATHRAAAEWYAVLPVSQVLESQAFHLEAAARLEEPDCDLLRRTVEAMVLYARSIEEERTQVSHQVLTRARTLVEHRPECGADVLDLELALASVSFQAGREAEAADAARRALALAEERGEARAAAEAHLHLGRVVIDADPDRSLQELAVAQEGYAGIGDPGGEARVEIARGFVRQHDEGIPQQLEGMERAYALAVRSADTRLQASCAQQLAMHHAMSTGRDGFALWAERARDMSRRDDLGLEPRLLVGEAVLGMWAHDAPSARHLSSEARTAGRDLGLRDVYLNALVIDIDLALLAGDLEAAQAGLEEARAAAATRPSPWWGLQLDLLEARIRSRAGERDRAPLLLEGVASQEMADNRVMRRDLAEARAWVALERGRFGEARALAGEAVGVDLETGERCSQLRPRLVELVATVAAGDSVSLGTIADLKALARETGLGTIVQLATRWLYVDELAKGWTVDLHSLEPCSVVECRALDLEIEALASARADSLLAAADAWSELGVTVWKARALLWHSELTGTDQPEARQLLEALQAPADLERLLRDQVGQLRS